MNANIIQHVLVNTTPDNQASMIFPARAEECTIQASRITEYGEFEVWRLEGTEDNVEAFLASGDVDQLVQAIMG